MHRHAPADVLALALRVLGDRQLADAWLDRPSVQLGGRTPRQLMSSADGARRVEELLAQIDDEDRLHAAQTRDISFFLCGDVMTGRGIDQILPHPCSPRLYERYMDSAVGYVQLAERATGAIERPADFAYVWGDALAELEREKPAARIVNLETAVTRAEDAWPNKGIHYRMHPDNVPCLSAARIDCCVLANNHSLDWGYAGLGETLDRLHQAGIATAGAGRDDTEAAAPATLALAERGRLLVYGFAMPSSGVPRDWAARGGHAGVNFLGNLSAARLDEVARQIHAVKRAGDIVVASIHWGPNWGYDLDRAEHAFARQLIDAAAVDLVHGHSSHHAKAIEVYRDRAILHGCGDFLNDYEGIGGYESFRPDLSLMYFPTLDAASGRLVRMRLVPMRMRHFRLNRAAEADARWMEHMLNREGRELGTRVERQADDSLELRWR
jgi:poly-gamma-glutamate capsule biosynthesis protein CapA/YwtB (metallophosphatase superfamily)